MGQLIDEIITLLALGDTRHPRERDDMRQAGESRERPRVSRVRGVLKPTCPPRCRESRSSEQDWLAVRLQIEQGSCVPQIGGVEPLREPLVDGTNDITRAPVPGTATMQAGQADGGAQLE